jgi:hypothetical protein
MPTLVILRLPNKTLLLVPTVTVGTFTKINAKRPFFFLVPTVTVGTFTKVNAKRPFFVNQAWRVRPLFVRPLFVNLFSVFF